MALPYYQQYYPSQGQVPLQQAPPAYQAPGQSQMAAVAPMGGMGGPLGGMAGGAQPAAPAYQPAQRGGMEMHPHTPGPPRPEDYRPGADIGYGGGGGIDMGYGGGRPQKIDPVQAFLNAKKKMRYDEMGRPIGRDVDPFTGLPPGYGTGSGSSGGGSGSSGGGIGGAKVQYQIPQPGNFLDVLR